MIDFTAATLAVICPATLATVGFMVKWRDDFVKVRTKQDEHEKKDEERFESMREDIKNNQQEILMQLAASRKEITDLLLKNQK